MLFWERLRVWMRANPPRARTTWTTSSGFAPLGLFETEEPVRRLRRRSCADALGRGHGRGNGHRRGGLMKQGGATVNGWIMLR